MSQEKTIIDYQEAYEKEHIKAADLACRVAELEEKNEELQFKLDRIKNNPLWKASKPARNVMHACIRQVNRLKNCGGIRGFVAKVDYKKREKEAKKNQKVIEIKEIQLTLNIDTHDIETKVNHAIRFLKAGNKVKVSIRFRGREMVHPERGLEIMQSFADACSEYGNVEKAAKLENRTMLMFLAAKSAK